MRNRLSTALQLRRFSRQLAEQSADRTPPALIYGAARRLAGSRPKLLKALRWGRRLGLKAAYRPGKLRLWGALAAGEVSETGLLEALQQTQAWQESSDRHARRLERRCNARWNHRGRLQAPDALLAGLREQGCRRVVFWHHFDRRGVLPQSWRMALQALRQQQWTVIVSSSGLNQEAISALDQDGILISQRMNLGLCLGAYRDFCCLLAEAPDLHRQCEQLLLVNDSTLPIGGATAMGYCLEAMASSGDLHDGPILQGMTDSIERDRYHLQSYWLLANGPLLRQTCWLHFWQNLELGGFKDDLIDRGEIGLSQALLTGGVPLRARYSLIDMLLDGGTTSDELQRHGRHNLLGVNLSLFAWQALLQAGCPLLKKQVALAPPDCGDLPIPLARLQHHLNDADHALRADLEQLLRSRHCDH